MRGSYHDPVRSTPSAQSAGPVFRDDAWGAVAATGTKFVGTRHSARPPRRARRRRR